MSPDILESSQVACAQYKVLNAILIAYTEKVKNQLNLLHMRTIRANITLCQL